MLNLLVLFCDMTAHISQSLRPKNIHQAKRRLLLRKAHEVCMWCGQEGVIRSKCPNEKSATPPLAFVDRRQGSTRLVKTASNVPSLITPYRHFTPLMGSNIFLPLGE